MLQCCRRRDIAFVIVFTEIPTHKVGNNGSSMIENKQVKCKNQTKYIKHDIKYIHSELFSTFSVRKLPPHSFSFFLVYFFRICRFLVPSLHDTKHTNIVQLGNFSLCYGKQCYGVNELLLCLSNYRRR